MASVQTLPRAILTIVFSSLLFLLLYINIHVMSRSHSEWGDIHNTFLQILEASVVTRRVRGKGKGVTAASDLPGNFRLDESNNAKVKNIDDKLWGMTSFVGESRITIGKMSKGGGGVDSILGSEVVESNSKTQTVDAPKQQTMATEENPTHRKQSSSTTTNMNILLLYADDWTHHTLSSYHKTSPLNTILRTPTLDALSSAGIRFTHNCVTTSVCWISRATLFTGQYMSRHGTREPCCWAGMERPKEKLKEAPKDWMELSVYEVLKKEGYHVGHAGKWGVYMPWPKGVDFNVEEDGWHYRKIGDKLWHITEKNEADALRFLATRPRNKPFFLNVAFFATHAKDYDARQYMPQNSSMSLYANDTIPIPPTSTDEAWKKMPYFFNEKNEGRHRWRLRFKTHTLHQSMMKNYYRMATEVDTACGAILEELRRQGELDNTLIIFTTDNGNFHSEHGLADKWYPHQESIRTPLIIRDPRMKEDDRGTTNDAFTLNIDLAPTILSAAGVALPEKYMGRDIASLYLETGTYDSWRSEFFYEHPVISKTSFIPSSEALVRKDYKYMYWPDFGYEQFFDLKRDPGEINDLSNSTDPENQVVLREMKRRFAELKKLVMSDEIVTL